MRGLFGALVVAASVSDSLACYLPRPQTTGAPASIAGNGVGPGNQAAPASYPHESPSGASPDSQSAGYGTGQAGHAARPPLHDVGYSAYTYVGHSAYPYVGPSGVFPNSGVAGPSAGQGSQTVASVYPYATPSDVYPNSGAAGPSAGQGSQIISSAYPSATPSDVYPDSRATGPNASQGSQTEASEYPHATPSGVSPDYGASGAGGGTSAVGSMAPSKESVRPYSNRPVPGKPSSPSVKPASSAVAVVPAPGGSADQYSSLGPQTDPSYPPSEAKVPTVVTSKDGAVIVSAAVPDDAGPNIPSGFVSFSLDDTSLLGYFGTAGTPNTLSVNLLQNLGDRMGVMPTWRIIGDEFFIDPNQKEATTSQTTSTKPRQVKGPTWFESFANMPNTKYVMGLNFHDNNDATKQNRLDSITALCQKLKPDMIERWEMGNEPDLYSATGARPKSYSVNDHAKEYVDATNAARAHMATACPGFSNTFFGTSIIGGDGSKFSPVDSFALGINDQNVMDVIATHSYMALEGTSKATLANLMTHSVVSDLVDYHSQIGVKCLQENVKLPYILGETNSIAGGGFKGISDVFGAALYTVDFSLRGAASGILRTHTHTGLGASYNAWEPGWGEANHPTYVGAPYFGHIFVAEMLGKNAPRLVEVGLPGKHNVAAYAAYENEALARVAVVNFEDGDRQYKFQLGSAAADRTLKLSILDAPDKSSKTGISFDGYSYTPESDGKPVLSYPAGSTTVKADGNGEILVTVKGVQAVMVHVV